MCVLVLVFSCAFVLVVGVCFCKSTPPTHTPKHTNSVVLCVCLVLCAFVFVVVCIVVVNVLCVCLLSLEFPCAFVFVVVCV